MAARGEPQDGIFRKQPLGWLEAAESESLVGMIEPQLELPASARVHPVLRFRREPQSHLPEELAPGEAEAVGSPTHTRCSIAVRLSLGGARRTKSPMLTYRPRCSRSVTTAVAVSSLQSRMNPSPTLTASE